MANQVIVSGEVLSLLGAEKAATPAQVEAINALASGKVPSHAVYKRQGRAGKTFSYVKHPYGNKLIRDAFGVLWSYEVLSTEAYDDNSASALVRLTLYVPQENGPYLEIRTTAVGAHEDVTGKMCKAFMVASAASRGLIKTLYRRFNLGGEFYQAETELTAKESWAALWRFAQRKNPAVERDTVVGALKEVGITKHNLVDRFEQAYGIVSQVVSTPLEDVPEGLVGTEAKVDTEVKTEVGTEARTDLLVEVAEKELGAETTSATSTKGQKVNFMALYAHAEEKHGFTSAETKAVLLDKFGKEWYYADKKDIADALEAAGNA